MLLELRELTYTAVGLRLLAALIMGGVLGLGIMVVLTVIGATHLLTPMNMFLYQLVWMIPVFLFTEWTRSV